MSKVNGAKYLAAPQHLIESILARPYDTNADGCRLWKGSTGSGGYGYATYRVGGRKQVAVYVHRLVYVHLVRDPGDGAEIDHLCHDHEACGLPPSECPHRRCYELSHLEAVPPVVNKLRSGSPFARHARKTHCDNGHAFSGDNLIIFVNGSRGCRECQRDTARRERERRRDEINARNRANAGADRAAREHRCQVCGADIHHRSPHAKFCELCTTDKPTRRGALQDAARQDEAPTPTARNTRREFLAERRERADAAGATADHERCCRTCGADISHRAAQAKFCEQCRPVKEAA